MKVPLAWLRDFIDLPTEDPVELDEILGSLGHEVEGWETIVPTFDGVTVGRVESVEPHPNADKLRSCRVDTGTETLDVVCGAWNFEAGAIIAYAGVGARLGLDQDQPFQVGQRTIRGVVSNGMICSARELGLGDDHEGILVLDGLGAAGPEDVGRDFTDVIRLRDTVLDVSITPNRGDCMSILGLARELGAYWELPVREPDLELAQTGPEISAQVAIADPVACPRFAARQVDGVRLGPSPLWMQLRLMAAGQRPISNVVDVSNYVMFEIGHPIHTFDADTIEDLSITIRRAEAGEHLTTLDGVDRVLEPDDIVVTDGTGVIALAGVMGGLTTEVSDTTTNVLVEAAHWDPPSIMSTSYRLGLRSEASARFERGVDPNLSGIATIRTAKLIAETGGGTVRAGRVDEYPGDVQPWTVTVTEQDIARLLGPAPDLEASGTLLTRLGFGVEMTVDALQVTVPTRRRDVTRAADVVEEIARLFGYENFEGRTRRGLSGRLSPDQARARMVRDVMVGAGFTEAQTLAFLGQADLDLLRIPAGDPRSVGLRVINPLREEEATMRTTLLPGLLKAVTYNVGHGAADVALFETGRVFLPKAGQDDPRVPEQPELVGFVALGSLGAGGYAGLRRDVDFYTASGVVEALAAATGVGLTVVQGTPPTLHPGRAALVRADDEVVGFVGELHPAIVRDFGLKGRVAVGELRLAPLVRVQEPWTFREASSFPPVRFDLAFEIASTVPAHSVARAIEEGAGSLLESIELFDEFHGGSLEAGRKSLAYRLVFRAPDRTLTDEEMVPVREEIVTHVTRTLDARLRGS